MRWRSARSGNAHRLDSIVTGSLRVARTNPEDMVIWDPSKTRRGSCRGRLLEHRLQRLRRLGGHGLASHDNPSRGARVRERPRDGANRDLDVSRSERLGAAEVFPGDRAASRKAELVSRPILRIRGLARSCS